MLDQIIPVALGFVAIIGVLLALAALLRARTARIRGRQRAIRDDHNQQVYDDWAEAQSRWDDQKPGS